MVASRAAVGVGVVAAAVGVVAVVLAAGRTAAGAAWGAIAVPASPAVELFVAFIMLPPAAATAAVPGTTGATVVATTAVVAALPPGAAAAAPAAAGATVVAAASVATASAGTSPAAPPLAPSASPRLRLRSLFRCREPRKDSELVKEPSTVAVALSSELDGSSPSCPNTASRSVTPCSRSRSRSLSRDRKEPIQKAIISRRATSPHPALRMNDR